jgi:hypothetical protein
MEREALEKLRLSKGAVLRVHWFDIYENPVGDTTKADVVTRTTYGVFWEVKPSPSVGVDCLVTTTTEDPDGPSEQGFTIYPLSIVLRLEVIHRPRAKKKKESPSNA